MGNYTSIHDNCGGVVRAVVVVSVFPYLVVC